jgi:Ca2+-binding RTX toxin-like protein
MPVSVLPGTSGNDVIDVTRGASPLLDLSAASQKVFILLEERNSAGWSPQGTSTTVDAVLTANGYAGDTPVGIAYGAEIGLDALIGIRNVITGTGDDIVVDSATTNFIDTGAGSDSIWLRGGGADTAYGGAGDDWFELSADLAAGGILDGGAGRDNLFVNVYGGSGDFGGFPVVDLTTANVRNFEEISIYSQVRLTTQLLTSFERVSGYGNLVLADRGAVIVKGELMFASLQLADGGQRIDFSQATYQGDLIQGGTGNDTIIAGYTVDAGLGNDLVVGNAAGGSLTGGGGNDVLRAGAGSSSLQGDAGRDSLIGGAGDDALYVYNAADLVRGEVYDGGAGNDTLQIWSGDLRGVTVRNIETLGGGDISISTAMLAKFGSVVVDTLTLTDNADVNLRGGLSARTVQLADGGQFVSLASVGQILGGTGDDTIVAGQYFGTVLGGAGNDRITLQHSGSADGGAGNDVLAGGDSYCSLTGGTGRDMFVYTTALASAYATNTITDFMRGADRVDLSAIDANAARAGNNAFRYIGDDAFTGHAGELHLAHANGTTILEGDTNGDGVADIAIALGGAEIGARDIVM